MSTLTISEETGPTYTPDEARRGMRLVPVTMIFTSSFSALTSGAVFTSFLAQFLQVSDFWYGLILAAVPAAVFVQYYGALTVERAGRVKPKYVKFSILQRLFWLVIAAVTLFSSHLSHDTRLRAVLAMVLCSSLFQHLGAGGLMTWFTTFVPRPVMGRFFGQRQRVGMTAMLIATTLAAFLLDRFNGQGWVYAALFASASLLGLIDLAVTARIPEHPRPVAESPTLRDIVRVPWSDPLARRYMGYAFLAMLVTTTLDPFILKYGFAAREVGGMGLSVTTANLLLFILPTLALAWGAPHWGHVIDRHGPRPVLTACMLGLIIVPCGWLVMRPSWVWLVPFLTLGAALFASGAAQVELYMRAQGFPVYRHTCYLVTLNIVLGVAALLGAFGGGVMATFWQHHLPAWLPAWASHYHLQFLTALLLRVVVFFGLLLRIPLPGSGTHSAIFRHLARSGLGR